jgi:hypothetical protein
MQIVPRTGESLSSATNAYLKRKHREELGILKPVEEKRCRKCGLTKARADFPASHQVSDGLSSWCRICHREATRQWKAKRKQV